VFLTVALDEGEWLVLPSNTFPLGKENSSPFYRALGLPQTWSEYGAERIHQASSSEPVTVLIQVPGTKNAISSYVEINVNCITYLHSLSNFTGVANSTGTHRSEASVSIPLVSTAVYFLGVIFHM
jgi:hypothetical protein